MKKLMVFGTVCFSATVLLAQTQKEKVDQAPAPVNTAIKMTPMNVKTGLWQSTTTVTLAGSLVLPPSMAAKLTPEQKAKYEAAMQAEGKGGGHTYTDKSCLTQKDLTTDPFAQKGSDEEHIHCHGTLLSSTSTDIVLQETCSGEASMTYTMKIHALDQEHAVGTGTGTATMGGRTMNSSVKSQSTWIGATCPAGVNHD